MRSPRPAEVTREESPRSTKVRVRWLDGEYEGLEEWVPEMRLLASREEANAQLDDERRMLARRGRRMPIHNPPR